MSKSYYVFTDIHGLNKQLRSLLNRVNDDIMKNNITNYEMVFLGDYVDRGPESAQLVEFLRDLQKSHVKTTMLLGNHEDMMIQSRDNRESWVHWIGNGGAETAQSYENHYGKENSFEKFKDDIEWMKTLPYYQMDEENKIFFVHAGVNVDEFPKMPSKEVAIWTRSQKRFFQADYSHCSEWLFVHGHTPGKTHHPDFVWDRDDNRLNLDTGACFDGNLTCARIDTNPRTITLFSVPGYDVYEL